MIDAPARPLLVSEVFGPTFQGEGPSCGRRAAFVRLGGCNLACSWCDTPYTWDWAGQNGTAYDPKAELRSMDAEDVLVELVGMGVPLVVVTGGEPLLQADRLAPLVRGLHAAGVALEVETNGTVAPPASFPGAVRFNVSPKLASANNRAPYLIPEGLAAFRDRGRSIFKFVCADTEALDEVDQIVRDHRLDPATVWIMPEGTTPERVLAGTRRLAGPTLARGYNLTTRLHTLLWGDERGR